MPYVSHAELADRPGARELAEQATPQHLPMVDFELMEATLLGGDRTTWSEEEIAVADEALSRVDLAVADAEALINGFLAKRGYVPLDPVPGIVANWTRVIARYYLHKDRVGTDDKDPVLRDYRDAIKLLQLTADGKFSLGFEDPVKATGTSAPSFTKGKSVFRDNLVDY
ncbi:gp436 family protein [Marinobacter sp.]|uniref:gp436 family protein n=1 Tax=Marinobacter sp. TaxID=50741 RepID=UPI0034A56161